MRISKAACLSHRVAVFSPKISQMRPGSHGKIPVQNLLSNVKYGSKFTKFLIIKLKYI